MNLLVRNSLGFTLVEILMVLVVVGILAAVAVPQYIDFGTEAKTSVTQQKLGEFKKAITGDASAVSNGQYLYPGFEAQVGALPATLNDLRVQGAWPPYDVYTQKGWRGPYISTSDTSWNLDGWGTIVQYTSATRTLRSCGKDKICPNADDIVLLF